MSYIGFQNEENQNSIGVDFKLQIPSSLAKLVIHRENAKNLKSSYTDPENGVEFSGYLKIIFCIYVVQYLSTSLRSGSLYGCQPPDIQGISIVCKFWKSGT